MQMSHGQFDRLSKPASSNLIDSEKLLLKHLLLGIRVGGVGMELLDQTDVLTANQILAAVRV